MLRLMSAAAAGPLSSSSTSSSPMMIVPLLGSASKDLRSRRRSCSWFQSCMIIEYTCTSCPGGSASAKKSPPCTAMRSRSSASAILSAGMSITWGQIEDGRAQRRVAPAQLDGERAGAAADVEQSRRVVEIDRVGECAGGEPRQGVHRLPERLEHRRVLALEHGALALRVPCCRSVGPDGLRELGPPGVEPPVEHRHQAAEVVAGASYQKPLAERRIAVAVVAAFEQPERRAAGQQHLRRSLLDAELAREFRRGRLGATGQAREQVELVGGRERLERPEAGRY